MLNTLSVDFQIIFEGNLSILSIMTAYQTHQAEVIRALFDRIQFLEQEVERLKVQKGLDYITNSQKLKSTDSIIENFLGGAGI